MKQHSTALLFCLAAATLLLSAAPAFPYYNPSTGRWLNRDPLGEMGFELVTNRPKVERESLHRERVARLVDSVRSKSPEVFGRLEKRLSQLGINLPQVMERSNLRSGPQADECTVDLYAFIENNPIQKLDPNGLETCDYICWRVGTLVPIYICPLQSLDACSGACEPLILIYFLGPGHGFHILLPFSTPCPGCAGLPPMA
jgi:hypothetical protein